MAATQGAAGGASILLQAPLDSIEPLNLSSLPDLTYLSREWSALEFDFGNPIMEGRRRVSVELRAEEEEAEEESLGGEDKVRVDGVASLIDLLLPYMDV